MPRSVPAAGVRSRFRRCRVALRDGRVVTLREIEEADAKEILAAFERLSPESRYLRFMQHKKQIEATALERGVHPRSGLEFVLVATVPADDGIDIVGAAQYVRADSGEATCEFAVTVADDWRGVGLAAELVSRLVRRARRDGYLLIEGHVLDSNEAMLALARDLGFHAEQAFDEPGVVRVRRSLESGRRRRQQVTVAR